MEQTIDTPANRVARGVEFLDQRMPGWDKRVRSERLNVANDEGCVIGQLFGCYAVGSGKLELQQQQAVELGFYSHETIDPKEKSAEYEALTMHWKQELIARMLRDPALEASLTAELVAV